MSETPSKTIPLGFIAPDFELLDVNTGHRLSLEELRSVNAVVIMFICNHCPFVKHIIKEIVAVANEFILQSVSFIAINSNDVDNYPEDSPENMKKVAKELKFRFPYLYDDTQKVAKAYGAECTPEFFIFDKELKLVYHGQFDASRPGNSLPVRGTDIRDTLATLIAGLTVDSNQKPSIGCNIKWKR